jgi:mono/diheme cytochrome c family protein
MFYSERLHTNRLVQGNVIRTIALLLALTTSAGRAAEPLTYYGFDKASHSAAAQEGLEEIFAGRLFHTLPAADVRMLQASLAGSGKGLGYDLDSEPGMFYALGRLPSPPSRKAGIATGFGLGESVFVRDKVQIANINCFTCHAGVVNGQVVAGLANNHVNQSEPNKLRTRGDNFGPYAVWGLIAQLADPAKEGLVPAKEKTKLLTMLESLELPPVDPMPWWLMKYKKKDYWYSDAGPHDAASFSINFTTAHQEMNAHHAEHVKSVAKALTFARETKSPPFPNALNAQRVRQGADLFHGRTAPKDGRGFTACATCHGSYTRKMPDSDLSRPGSWTVAYDASHRLKNAKTDSSYNETLKKLRPIADHLNKLKVYYTAKGTPELIPNIAIPTESGYVAPPLVGVWASAPYFHNGSVPTLEAVLNSQIRPEIWSRDNRDHSAYDLEKVGMKYRSVPRSEYEKSAVNAAGKAFLSQAAIDHGAIYDTKGFGHGNMGHTFGDRLTADERFAIIEFLKSLSGPDME